MDRMKHTVPPLCLFALISSGYVEATVASSANPPIMQEYWNTPNLVKNTYKHITAPKSGNGHSNGSDWSMECGRYTPDASTCTVSITLNKYDTYVFPTSQPVPPYTEPTNTGTPPAEERYAAQGPSLAWAGYAGMQQGVALSPAYVYGVANVTVTGTGIDPGANNYINFNGIHAPITRGVWLSPAGAQQGGTVGAGLSNNYTYDHPYKAAGSVVRTTVVLNNVVFPDSSRYENKYVTVDVSLLTHVRNSSAVPNAADFAMQVPQGALTVNYRYLISMNIEQRCNLDYNETISKPINHGNVNMANAHNHVKSVAVRIDCNSATYSLSLSTNNPGSNQYDNSLSVNMTNGWDSALSLTAPHCTQHPQYVSVHLQCTAPMWSANDVELTSTLKQTDSSSAGSLSGTAVLTATID